MVYLPSKSQEIKDRKTFNTDLFRSSILWTPIIVYVLLILLREPLKRFLIITKDIDFKFCQALLDRSTTLKSAIKCEFQSNKENNSNFNSILTKDLEEREAFESEWTDNAKENICNLGDMIDVFVDQELKRDNPTGECFRVELCTNFHKKKS